MRIKPKEPQISIIDEMNLKVPVDESIDEVIVNQTMQEPEY